MTEVLPKTFSAERDQLAAVREQVARVVVGQSDLVDKLLLAMLCSGHVLIEGVPGLAKTLVVSTLAQALGTRFSRIQFTPDLLPGDLLGTLVFNPQTGEFAPHKGPVFCNILLADEINRSPAKVQSALLEAMQEKQVTIGEETFPLDEPFLVLATQNPIEQEGTYTLPEAQLDRFMFKLSVDYPSIGEEKEVMRRMSKATPSLDTDVALTGPEILELRTRLDDVHMEESLEDYILRLVAATRRPDEYGLGIGPWIRHGASPRASIYLAKAARGRALTEGRDYVVPGDIKDVAPAILNHRVAVTYKAEAAGIDAPQLVGEILGAIPLP